MRILHFQLCSVCQSISTLQVVKHAESLHVHPVTVCDCCRLARDGLLELQSTSRMSLMLPMLDITLQNVAGRRLVGLRYWNQVPLA